MTSIIPMGTEFLVNTATLNYQFGSSVTALSNGGFVVTWLDTSGEGGDSSSTGVKAQVFDASGAKLGTEFLVNTVTDGAQTGSSVTALSNGGFVVTWTGEDSLTDPGSFQ